MASAVKEAQLSAAKIEIDTLRRALRKSERDGAAASERSAEAKKKASETIAKFANAFGKMREAKAQSDLTVSELRATLARVTLNTDVENRRTKREAALVVEELELELAEAEAFAELESEELRADKAALERRVAAMEATLAEHAREAERASAEAMKTKTVLMFERAAKRGGASLGSHFERTAQKAGVAELISTNTSGVAWERARAAQRLLEWANRSIESATILPIDVPRAKSPVERSDDPASTAAESRWEQLETLMRRFLEVSIPGAKKLRLQTLRLLKEKRYSPKRRGYDRDPPLELTPRLDRAGVSTLGYLTEFLEDNGRTGGTMNSVVSSYTQHIDPAFPSLIPVRKKGREARAQRKARFTGELRSALGAAGSEALLRAPQR
jgi:hypothetical protein